MLVVTDFGQRIQTPWREALSPRSVQPLSPSQKSDKIEEDEASKSLQQKNQGKPSEHAKQLADYEQVAENSPRQQVREAEQIMSDSVISLNMQQTTLQAWEIMQTRHIHHLTIIDEQGRLQGIVSDRDLLLKGINQQTAASIMQTQVLCGARHTPIRDIAEAMSHYRISALPLIDQEQRIDGIITRHDILLAVLQQAPIELWT